ncbi:MAG: V-type ATPase 116kDa subunit family protein [Nitrososphaerales archaeon]
MSRKEKLKTEIVAERHVRPRIQHTVPMVKIAAFVHKNYINQVMYELGKLESLQLIDAHKSLKEFKEPEISEPIDYSIKIASILSRADYLKSLLKVKFRAKKKVSIPTESVDALLKWSEEKISLMEKEVSNFQNEMARLDKEGLSNSEKETILQAMLIGLSRQVGADLETIIETLEAQQKIEEVKALMVRTKNVYCFEGWVPEERLDKVLKTIKESAGGYGDIIYVKKAPSSAEEIHKDYEVPPSLLRYPKITGVFLVFSGLTKAFGLPSYYEIDPTLPFLITFPIIFGLMFGDVGHGAILFASGIMLYLLKNKLTLRFKPGSIVYYVIAGSPLIAINGIAAMLIGFLYGELFGSEEWFHALTGLPGPLWFSPYHNPMKLLKYSIMVGVFQISLGLMLDLIGKLSSKRFKEAITGPIPWLWLYWSGSYLVFSYGWDVFKAILDIYVIGPYILLPFGVLAILKFITHGINGVTEALEAMVTSFSNTVSYARILALKMIHTAFSILFLPTGLIGMIMFPIGTFLIIIIFEGMLAFLHTLRLHWIEWFTKFYTGKGKPFQPFTLGTYPVPT